MTLRVLKRDDDEDHSEPRQEDELDRQQRARQAVEPLRGGALPVALPDLEPVQHDIREERELDERVEQGREFAARRVVPIDTYVVVAEQPHERRVVHVDAAHEQAVHGNREEDHGPEGAIGDEAQGFRMHLQPDGRWRRWHRLLRADAVEDPVAPGAALVAREELL